MRKVFIRLREGYGVGDAVQFTVVLKHLLKYRPDWQIDFQAQPGRHKAGLGLVNAIFHDDEAVPGPYDQIIDVRLYDNYAKWPDRPNTKVTACLHETFGIPYDKDLGRYQLQFGQVARQRAWTYYLSVGANDKAVLIHYEGHSNSHRKNLHQWQIEDVCQAVIAMGYVPVIVDWLKNPLHGDGVFATGFHDWKGWSGADAELLAALISQAKAFVGIDSGPAHAASATETPSLVCWTKHHPVQFHDPAPNTMHLIPDNHETIDPADAPGVAEFFYENYLYRTYNGAHGLVTKVMEWLAETLGLAPIILPVQFVIPADRKAAQWVLAKIRNVAQGRPIDVIVSGDRRTGEGKENVDLLKTFQFIRSAEIKEVPVFMGPERPQNTRGHYLYVPDGVRGRKHFLIPNHAFQEGRNLEEWLPDIPVDTEVTSMEAWHALS